MNFKIETIPNFEKEAKHLLKKYASLKNELEVLISSLEKNPKQGIHLGGGVYKIRLAVSSKGKGKSGGGRVITQIKVLRQIVYLVSIYDKSEKEDISDKDLQNLLKQIN